MNTASKQDIQRYLDFLKSETDSLYLYKRLAQSEKDAHLAEVYRRLAENEGKHAAHWRTKLEEAGVKAPEFKPSLRARWLGWLAGRLGPGTVLPVMIGMEHSAFGEYDTEPSAIAAKMPGDERSHARVFRYLGASGQGLAGSVTARLEGRHRAIGGNALRAGVLGANDGLVSNLSLVMGVAGANLSAQTVLIAGLAGLLAGALSMAIGEWVSVRSAREMYENQMRIEEQELAEVPEEEQEELALIYQAKGMSEEDARQVARRLLEDPATALDTLAREELGVDPDELGGSPWQAAGTSFLLFAGGATVPVLPFMVGSGVAAVAASAGLSALALFLLGSGITLLTGRGIIRSGVRQAALGLAAAAITFGIGKVVGISLAG